MIRYPFWEGFTDSQPSVTQIGNHNSDLGKTPQIPLEDAFLLVHLMTEDCPSQDPCTSDKSVRRDALPADVATLYHLRRDAIAELHCPSGDLSFYLARFVLDEIVDHVREQRVRALYFRHGRAYDDSVMRSLSQVLIPALVKPDQFNALFADHVGRALRAHVACAYGDLGGMQSTRPCARGGLAPWQERRAKDVLSNDLSRELPIPQLASECGLSASHFTRAFRQSLGMAPHQWRLSLRIERAKEKLLNSDASLAEIAIDCGFGDQCHFTRVFTKHTGVSPGYWRRQHVSGPIPTDGS
jgi:AraC-like DNA-binding protein